MADAEFRVSIKDRLLKERHALLDLSSRNRLVNVPLRTDRNRSIEIVDERSAEVFRLLTDGKGMSFVAGAGEDEPLEQEGGNPEALQGAVDHPVVDGRIDARGIPLRHTDLKLQTRLKSINLEKRLLDMWYDAHTLEEETGVNILYLAIGLLRWYEADNTDTARHAPLILLPVRLERGSAADRFKLRWREEPPLPNLSLQAKLKVEFGLELEDFQDEDALDLPAYFAKVAQTVAKQARWQVLLDSMILGFFSFSKFLMYRDLDPENWPKDRSIDTHDMIAALLRDGFTQTEELVGDNDPIDLVIPPLALNHIVDADSSQAVAIAEAAGGRTMVVKGPPGTGKSQTITNIIAGAVAQGKKVLFVAEKMAALDVVHRRLRQAGLGPLTLELHSNKANKREILEELKRTRDAQPRLSRSDAGVIEKLGQSREVLNGFVDRLHTPLQPCSLTPYQIMGRLILSLGKAPRSTFRITGAEAWTPGAVQQRARLVADLAERLEPVAPVPLHPWRGVGCEALNPSQLHEIGQRIDALQVLLDNLREAATKAAAVHAPPAARVRDFSPVAVVLEAVASLPNTADRMALAHPAWTGDVDGLEALVAAGQNRARAYGVIEGRVKPAALTAELSGLRATLSAQGRNPWRFLDGRYRSDLDRLRLLVEGPLPKTLADRLVLVDQMQSAQDARDEFEPRRALGAAFGTAWRDEASDWAQLGTWLGWRRNLEGISAEFYPGVAHTSDLNGLSGAHRCLRDGQPELQRQLSDLFDMLRLDVRRAFEVDDRDAVSLDRLAERLRVWRADPRFESLTRFIGFAAGGRQADGMGLSSLVADAHEGTIEPSELPQAFEQAYAGVLQSLLFATWPELSAFDGKSWERQIDWFRQLDRDRIELAKEQIAARHADGRPKGSAGIGPLGVLSAELAKKQRFLPIRVLLDKAGPAIQQLKPVFMMSPLSVAQYLKPGGPQFDILVMDEASQIEPVDALGAIARARQLVVVGDERQLPPTAFFRKLAGEGDGPEEGADEVIMEARDAESILDLCLAKGAPSRMLNWHYRSKHQSLIAVSNREFYENKLFIVPSPYNATAGMGLKFNYLPNAPYDRGESRTNPTEAKIVAEAVLRHAREQPNLSLGVATFSVAQSKVIGDELELLRRRHPELESFVAAEGTEKFFVKNLENIQGEERDVIFISVGYGKTAEGYLAHQFGPLSSEGGERRLNVLISRAKQRCEVFLNFTGADIDPQRSRARGVMAFKMFLTFAETGKFGQGEETGLDHDSPFEAEVATRLRALGYDVRAQIGASGFRVDLALADPDRPGRFMLGIECDGAQYHSSRSARDRDRLRQQVLEGHGWIIHRIWSTDWFLRPREELQKVVAAYEAARSAWRERDAEGGQPSPVAPASFRIDDSTGEQKLIAVGRTTPVTAEPLSVPYREAAFHVDTRAEPHETPVVQMVGYVVKVIQAEGPVHLDEVAARIRTLWGFQRAGNRIRLAVARAAEMAVRQHQLSADEFFYSLPSQPVVVRDRSQVASAGLRKPDMLPPAEIDAALLAVVGANFGAGRAELAQVTARAFGFASTSAQLRSVLDAGIDRLLRCSALQEQEELLTRMEGAEVG